MRFEPGNNYGKGRPAGAKNKRTEQWEKFAEYLLTKGLQKFEAELEELSGKQFVDAVVSIMEYFKPKLSRSTLDGDININSITDLVAKSNNENSK